MKVDLAAVLGGYRKKLGSLRHILARGMEHCRQNEIAESEMLEWRLAPDMFPLRQQAQFVCNLAAQWGARAAGLDLPPAIEGESSIADLDAAISEAELYLDSLRPEQFAERDEVPLTVNLGAIEPTMPIGQWVLGFATTNFDFHLSIAYAILRSRGVPLGKQDLFAGGL